MKNILVTLFVFYQSFIFGTINSSQSLFIGPAYIDDEIIYSKSTYPSSFHFQTTLFHSDRSPTSVTASIVSYETQQTVASYSKNYIDTTNDQTLFEFFTPELKQGGYTIIIQVRDDQENSYTQSFFLEVEPSPLLFSIKKKESLYTLPSNDVIFEYDLSRPIDQLSMYITNESGDLIWKYIVQNVHSGYQTFQWNKENNIGELSTDNTYIVYCLVKKNNILQRQIFTFHI